jgi:hypothetical protein
MRFAVLFHDWPTPHYDLLLERGGVLKAWRLKQEPLSFPLKAEPNFDHRLRYLDFEGELEGHRGSVSRWDSGFMTWLSDDDFELAGKKLRGRFRLGDTLELLE